MTGIDNASAAVDGFQFSEWERLVVEPTYRRERSLTRVELFEGSSRPRV